MTGPHPVSSSRAFAGAALYGSAVVVASLAARDLVWGLSAPGAFGPLVLALLATVAVAAAHPAADRRLAAALGRLGSRGEGALVATAVALAPIVGWALRVRMPWRGDQPLWLRSVSGELRVGHLLEPLSFALTDWSRDWLPHPPGTFAPGPALLDALLGAPFVLLAWLLARALAPGNRSARVVVWLVMIVSPASLLFRGYVESYGPLLLALLAAAWLALGGGGAMRYAGAWFAVLVGSAFHLLGAGAIPATAAVARTRGRRWIAASATAAIVLGVLAWRDTGARRFAYQEKSLAETLLFLTPPGGRGATFLGREHLLGTLNILLVWGGPLLWMALPRLLRRPGSAPRDAVRLLALLVAVGAGGLAVVRLSLGAARDWDLFGPFLFFLTPLLALAWRGGDSALPRGTALLLVLAAIHGQTWALLDVPREAALARAERLYGPATRFSPDAVALTADELAYIARLDGDGARAATWYERAAAANPGNWRFFNNAGAQYLRLGESAKAESLFVEAIARSPSSADPFANLGAILVDRRDLGRALGVFDRGLTRWPTDDRLLLGRGWTLYFLGRYGEASAALDSSLAIAPGRPEILRLAAQAALNSGRRDVALRHMLALTEAAPADTAAWRDLARVAEAAGDTATARRARERRRALAP